MLHKEINEQFKGLYAEGTSFPEKNKMKNNNRKTTVEYNS